jgi:glucan 1,3-beta-glucosidase
MKKQRADGQKVTPPIDPMPAISDYTQVGYLGGGSFGQVWMVLDQTGYPCALKIIRKSKHDNEYAFNREFSALTSYRPIADGHIGVLKILHIGQGDEFFYYTMPLADNLRPGPKRSEQYEPASLAAILKKYGHLSCADAILVLLPVLDAVAYLHEQGVVHRDIKPDCILFMRGKPVLGDISLLAEPRLGMTAIGTPGYSPIKRNGTKAADLYAIGKVLYTAITGFPPDRYPDVSSVVDLDAAPQFKDVNKIINRACELGYESASEMAEDLKALLPANETGYMLFRDKFGKKVRGVNLGGWLVLEKWMTPSLFGGLKAADETSFCVELGEQAEKRLKRHWDRFITEQDFAWLAKHGVTAVRIPVGYWIFGQPYPRHDRFGENEHPFVKGGITVLDRAFDWAEKHGLLIVLDLHAAPGCQNGFDNGGMAGVCDWHKNPDYINYSLEVLEGLAKRYRNRPALHGIEVLNEPHWDIPVETLKDYYRQAYQRIRKYCLAADVAVIFNEWANRYQSYVGFMRPPEYENVVYDIHHYQCFDESDKALDIHGHVAKAATGWKAETDAIIRDLKLWTYVGEWSLGLPAAGTGDAAQNRFQHDAAYRAYGAAQLLANECHQGWFFWSYKTEDKPAWSFKECVKRGWLPNNYA